MESLVTAEASCMGRNSVNPQLVAVFFRELASQLTGSLPEKKGNRKGNSTMRDARRLRGLSRRINPVRRQPSSDQLRTSRMYFLLSLGKRLTINLRPAERFCPPVSFRQIALSEPTSRRFQ